MHDVIHPLRAGVWHNPHGAMMVHRKAFVEVLNEEQESFSWICSTIESLGWTPRIWDTPQSFAGYAKRSTINCLVVGHFLPGIGAEGVLTQLQQYEDSALSIVVTRNLSVRKAVRMMHLGAFDIISRPRETDRLEKDLKTVMQRSLQTYEERDSLRSWKRELLELNELEEQVARAMCSGVPNATLANRLGLGVRTVEKYRRQLLDKFQAKSLPELIRIFYDIAPDLLDLEPNQTDGSMCMKFRTKQTSHNCFNRTAI